MNQLFAPLMALVAMLGGSCAPAPRVESAETTETRVRAEIMPLFTAMQAAANIHDAEAHLAPFARGSEVTFVVNGQIIRGWDKLLAQQRAWWPGGRIPLADEARQPYPIVEAPEFQLLGPRHAMLTFVIDARRVHPDRVMRRPLAVSQLWERRSEGWKIIHVHESVGPERPES